MNNTKWKLTVRFLLALVLTITFAIIAYISINLFLLYKDMFNPNKALTADDVKWNMTKHIQVTETGVQIDANYLQTIQSNNGWIQILDETGTELYQQFKPSSIPVHYTPAELLYYYKYAGSLRNTDMDKGYTLFSDIADIQHRKLTYIVAFPEQHVYRFWYSFNGAALTRDLILTFLLVLFAALLAGYLFSYQIVNPISHILDSIRRLAKGKYTNVQGRSGLFEPVYQSLNHLSQTLANNEKQQKKLETMREDWITNITHDVKTPLSSVKGYSELLIDSMDAITASYAKIIWNKANYIEQLTDDLKLTYQIQSIPISKQTTNLVEVMRETIIQILNHPSYMHTIIEYEPLQEEILFACDVRLLKRACSNLLYNAIVHNPKDTKITVSLQQTEQIVLTITDIGQGIPKEELDHLFERYYRGTNTGESHKGSGLGMAIAKQIVEAHTGTIHIDSTIHVGTTITIIFPSTQ